jgi:hypothetical protein
MKRARPAVGNDAVNTARGRRRERPEEAEAVLRGFELAKMGVDEPDGFGEVVTPEDHGAVSRGSKKLESTLLIPAPGEVGDPRLVGDKTGVGAKGVGTSMRQAELKGSRLYRRQHCALVDSDHIRPDLDVEDVRGRATLGDSPEPNNVILGPRS